MACTSMTQAASTVNDGCKEEINGLCRSMSGINLHRKRVGIRRSYSDNHLCYSINRIQASSTKPTLKTSRSVGIFPTLPFQISTSIRSFLFDLETSKDSSSMVEKDVNIDENSMENDDEEKAIKRANWLKRLLEIRSRWKYTQLEEGAEGDGMSYDGDESGADGDCDGDDGGCEVNYDSEEEGGGSVKYDRESFSKLLAQVPLSETKLFSKLAFLCNIAYVIPEIKVCIFHDFSIINVLILAII